MISDKQRRILEEEESLHQRVREGVRDAALARQPASGEMAKDIAQLHEDAKTAHARDLPSLLEQLHVQHSLAGRDKEGETLPDMRAPYFGHMRLEEDGKTRDVLIGHHTFIDGKRGVSIIDWRHAPIAQIYFNFREGDQYEVELPAKIAKGTLVARRLIHFEKGQLLSVTTTELKFRREPDGDWEQEPINLGPILSGGEGSATRQFSFGTGQSQRRPSEIASLLDAQQYRLLQEDPDRPLLILGSAGSGKTTVALHRLAALFFKNSKRFAQHKLLVIVPEPGLLRLSQKLLKSLQMNHVKLFTYDDWVAWQGKHLLRSLPKNICAETPAKVIRFKRHAAILSAFPLLEERRIELIKKNILSELKLSGPHLAEFDQIEARNLSQKLDHFESRLRREVENDPGFSEQRDAHLHSIARVFAEQKRELQKVDFERFTLFSDEDIVRHIIKQSKGELEDSISLDVLQHARSQFGATARQSFVEEGSEYERGVDARDFSDGDEGVVGTVDLEDFPILLELLYYYTGQFRTAHGSLHTYEHLVIDEAQELSAVELQLLGHSLTRDGNVTIAGDAMQQTESSSEFGTWDQVLLNLGVEQVEAEHLTTSYRCPAPIMNFAYDVLGPIAAQRPETPRDGVPVRIDKFSSNGEAATTIIEALEQLMEQEPRASVAVITQDFDGARRVFHDLEQVVGVRLVENGEFTFTPGVDVADVAQVKGLEFDYVIIPDADAATYPATPDARRLLHVAATRAIFQLWVLGVGVASPLITANKEPV